MGVNHIRKETNQQGAQQNLVPQLSCTVMITLIKKINIYKNKTITFKTYIRRTQKINQIQAHHIPYMHKQYSQVNKNIE